MEMKLKGTKKFRKDRGQESRLKEKLLQEGKWRSSDYRKSEVEMPEMTVVLRKPQLFGPNYSNQ